MIAAPSNVTLMKSEEVALRRITTVDLLFSKAPHDSQTDPVCSRPERNHRRRQRPNSPASGHRAQKPMSKMGGYRKPLTLHMGVFDWAKGASPRGNVCLLSVVGRLRCFENASRTNNLAAPSPRVFLGNRQARWSVGPAGTDTSTSQAFSDDPRGEARRKKGRQAASGVYSQATRTAAKTKIIALLTLTLCACRSRGSRLFRKRLTPPNGSIVSRLRCHEITV
jgi:hypothetical protein